MATAVTTFAAAQGVTEKIQIVAPAMCCKGCAQVAAQTVHSTGRFHVEARPRRATLVTVTFKPSPKLTLGGLWLAAEKADGKPSKLVTPQATFTLQRPEQLKLTEPLAPGLLGGCSNDSVQRRSAIDFETPAYRARRKERDAGRGKPDFFCGVRCFGIAFTVEPNGRG